MPLKIIVESNIPYIRGVLDSVARVQYLQPHEITPEAMRPADALITRTRVRCDARLLEGSQCRFIASATIGLDHVDIPWCEAHGIEVANAPGCNAPAVAQYVMAAIIATHGTDNLSDVTLGIVGVGHVGTIVDRWARSLGMKTLLCDPPRAFAEGPDGFVDLPTIAREANVITFHTPLTHTGEHATYHLASREFFDSLKRQPLIINSARGAVADNAALVDALHSGLVSRAAIDCWENEPRLLPSLLEKATIATPHIAGYSLPGKIRATAMAVDAVAKHFGLTPNPLEVPLPPDAPQAITAADILSTYSPAIDTMALKARPHDFEALRNYYPLRPEPGI